MLALLLSACPSDNISKYPEAGKTSARLTMLRPDTTQHSVWHALSNHLKLNDDISHPLVIKELDYFLKHPDALDKLTTNAKPYLYYVYQQTRKRDMPAEIALLPMIESNYTPFGVSSTGATGLWQMMPGTASGFGIHINWWYDGRRDIKASTNAALNYLAYLHNKFGNWTLAIAAYNSGEGTVAMAIEHNKKLGKPTNYWALPLPYQTKMYVPKLLALANIISNTKQYHIKLQPIPNSTFFKTVTLHHQIDLNRVAQLSNTPLPMIRLLNPGLRRWATMPDKPYALLLPENKVYTFIANLRQHKKQLITWIHHRIKPGESLYAIADKYHTQTAILQKVNNLKGDLIHPHQNLLIPLAYNHLNLQAIQKAPLNIAEDKIPGPEHVVHNVVKNDSLTAISKRYHVTPDQIRYWNNLAYRAQLKVHQPLTIWVQHHFRKPIFYTYKVRSGDSLIRIAKRFGTHVHTLQRLNHLRGDVIQLGLTLNIPKLSHHHGHYIAKLNNQLITHHVHPGETLSSIAHYYSIPIRKLMAWNHLDDTQLLSEGEVLHIYLESDQT